MVAVVAVALLARSYVAGAVFRGEAVVFLANDPYFYRFAVERHVAAAAGDPGALFRYEGRDPFLVVALSLAVALLGGVERAAVVLVWYPVVAGVATVALVYGLAALVSGSRLVGVAAAATLALTPAHVVRTAVGFADHHAADYLWLVATATLLVVLWRPTTTRRRAATGVALGVVVAVQALSWEAGPMRVVPAAAAVVGGSVIDVAAGRRPGVGLAAAGGFVVAALLVAAAFLGLGWQTDGVVLAVGLLAGGVVVATVALAALARTDAVRPSSSAGATGGGAVAGRGSFAPAVAVAAGVAAAGVALAAAAEALAPVRSLVAAGVAFLDASRGSGIAETVSLVGGPLGPVTGPLSLFGLLLFVALPPLVVVSVRALRERRVGWLVVAAYAWYFLAWALLQRRFAGELSPFVAVLVGVALVALARRTGLGPGADPGRPLSPPALGSLRRVGPVATALLLALLVVTSSGVLAVKLNQSVATDAEYGAAVAMRAYAVDGGLQYPESHVLSGIGTNRLYNYEVNRESVPELSYRYAEAHYATFVAGDSPDREYWRHHERVGFVVTSADAAPAGAAASPVSTHTRLHHRLGSDGDGVAGTGHYRLVYASPDDSVRAFALVPGAVVVGAAAPGDAVALSLPVTVGDRSFVYERETTAAAVGRYAVVVPYPGTYVVDGRAVTVTESAVREGRFVPVSTAGDPLPDPAGDPEAGVAAPASAHWTFDEGHGAVAFDLAGGAHGRLREGGPAWVDGGLDFHGAAGVVVPDGPSPTAETGLALTVRFAGLDAVDRSSPDRLRFQRLVATAPASRYTSTAGYQVGVVDGRVVGAVGDGARAADVRGPAVDDGEPHTVSLLWDGATVRLVVDGRVVDEAPYAGAVTPTDRLVIGATTDDRYGYRGVITDLRIDLVAASVPPDSHAAGDATTGAPASAAEGTTPATAGVAGPVTGTTAGAAGPVTGTTAGADEEATGAPASAAERATPATAGAAAGRSDPTAVGTD
jgi:dolichyl-diphosphooligosaccharide--protein glycosyltransferase